MTWLCYGESAACNSNAGLLQCFTCISWHQSVGLFSRSSSYVLFVPRVCGLFVPFTEAFRPASYGDFSRRTISECMVKRPGNLSRNR